MVLRAYFDDSEDKVPEAKPRMLVYAGYVATEDQWKAFREDWNAVRKAEPAIEFFKMSHAMEGMGQFQNMEWPFRELKIRAFYEVIKKHVSGSTFSAVLMDDFNEVMNDLDVPSPFRNPHFFSYYGIVQNLGKGLPLFKLEGPVSFFFDQGSNAQADIFSAWDSFCKYGPISKDILSGSPSFLNSKEFPPVQAADYLAWRVRIRLGNLIRRKADNPFSWEGKGNDVKLAQPIIWNKANLQAYIERTKAKKISA
ncbi:MAG: DUF3800 domain-containing protein [Micavibrio sp.]|nr:DUF3800 domain-containing protein [Micavibrio sp.]